MFHQPWGPAHRETAEEIPEFLHIGISERKKSVAETCKVKAKGKEVWQETRWVPVNWKRTTRKPLLPTTFTCRFFSAAASTGGISNHPDGAFVLNDQGWQSPTAMLLYCNFRDFKSLAARLLVWPNYGQQVKMYKVNMVVEPPKMIKTLHGDWSSLRQE